MPESIHQRVERERKAAQPEATALRDFRDYAAGRQASTLDNDQRKILGQLVKHRHADNVLHMILAVAASRLETVGWRVDDDDVQTFLDALYVKNQLSDLLYDATYATLRDGNHALALRWAADAATMVDVGDGALARRGRVTVHRERWWDGVTGMWVAYDEANTPVYAVKDFKALLGDPPVERDRRTVYWPDRIERYIKEGNGWQSYVLPGDGGWPVPWTKRDGSPLGLPVIHLANGSADDTPYGASDFAGGLLGLQDELNDVQRDITAAARLTGYQMYWATGVEPERDAGGNPKPLPVGPGRTLQSGRPDARFGVIPAGDMSKLIEAHRHKLQTIAVDSSTPLHLITGGDWPSGLALIRAEMPLVSKVQRLAKTLGPAWATVAHRATELGNAFGGLALNEDALVTAVFAAPEKLDAQTLAEIDKLRVEVYAALSALDDPLLMVKTGLVTEEEARQIADERQARAAAFGLPVPEPGAAPGEAGQGQQGGGGAT